MNFIGHLLLNCRFLLIFFLLFMYLSIFCHFAGHHCCFSIYFLNLLFDLIFALCYLFFCYFCYQCLLLSIFSCCNFLIVIDVFGATYIYIFSCYQFNLEFFWSLYLSFCLYLYYSCYRFNVVFF